jgi:hypothetical protein
MRAKANLERRIHMKIHMNRLFTIAAIGFITVCASAMPAAAQNRVKGSFTLSHEIRWQNATLPAGDYTFSMQSAKRMSPMIVTGPNGSVFELASVISESKASGRSVLMLERCGGTFFVSEMDLAGVGLRFRYHVPEIPRDEQELAQGPASTEQVLIAMVKK